MIYPTKFVSWKEVSEWSWLLARKIKDSRWRPEVVIAVGRGGLIVSRLLCDLLNVEKLLPVLVKWHEPAKKKGETYLADLIRVFVRASKGEISPEEGIAKVVDRLEARLEVEQEANLSGQKVLLVEEIVATGMHFKVAGSLAKEKWGASEIRMATLI